jgi:aspartate aminotransferase-like enzyme
MATALVGQFDPAFTALMAETQELLRRAFRTANRRTFPVSGTSRAGMEAAVVSLVEPGDRVLVVENGRFGLLFEEIARRAGAEVVPLRAPWGEPIDPAAVARALAGPPVACVLVVHAETSTGVLNPVREVAAAAHRQGALVVVDAVCSFAGAPLETDAWALDVVVAGTQKCLGCPSGLAPVTYTDDAAARMARRRTPVRSNYLDLTQLDRYWSPERLNHHTAPTTMVYGLREALRLALDEGLEARLARHRAAGEAMAAGVAALGLDLYGPRPGDPAKMPMLAAVHVPAGVDDAAFRSRLLAEHAVEIMGAFGPLAGRIWRIGTMADNARREPVLRTLAALAAVLGPRALARLDDALDAARARLAASPWQEVAGSGAPWPVDAGAATSPPADADRPRAHAARGAADASAPS